MTVVILGKVNPRIPAAKLAIVRRIFDFSAPFLRLQALTERVVDAHDPCHALLSLNGGEDLGGVLESDRTFTHGVPGSCQ